MSYNIILYVKYKDIYFLQIYNKTDEGTEKGETKPGYKKNSSPALFG